MCDLARVARVPEFINYNHDNPFLVKTLQFNDSPVLSIQELSKALGLNLKNPYERKEFRKKISVDLSSDDPIYEVLAMSHCSRFAGPWPIKDC